MHTYLQHCVHLLLGYEVDKPSTILIEIWNAMEYIELNIQNIEAPRTYNPII